jgi:hypothetical protein
MHKLTNASVRFASVIIWLLQGVGLLSITVLIPTLSQELAQRYEEYTGDQFLIQSLLSCIVIAGQLTLGAIAWLLMRVKKSKLLDSRSSQAVRFLMGSLFAVSGLLAALLTWLIVKNTLPPSLLVGLSVSILLSAAAGFVVAALNRVLREATNARIELESVI